MSQVPEPGRYDGCLWCDRIISGRLGPRPRRLYPLGPLLASIGLAIRFTKVTGELLIELLRNHLDRP